MRGGYPIQAVTIEQHRIDTKTGVTTVRTWHQAQSTSPRGSRLYVNCGHKHKTIEAARECMSAVETKYRAMRWPKREELAR